MGKCIFYTGMALKYILIQNISGTSTVFRVHDTLLNIEILYIAKKWDQIEIVVTLTDYIEGSGHTPNEEMYTKN